MKQCCTGPSQPPHSPLPGHNFSENNSTSLLKSKHPVPPVISSSLLIPTHLFIFWVLLEILTPKPINDHLCLFGT